MKLNFLFKIINILSLFLTTFLLSLLFRLELAIAPSRHPILTAQISEKSFCQTAAKFTVKIISGQGWGTGILVQKQENVYTLVTNGHVLKDKMEKFVVETEEGQQYQGSLLVNFHHGKVTGHDLAILQFNSQKSYPIASLVRWQKGERVMAVGFPMDVNVTNSKKGGLTCTKFGEVSKYLAKPMRSGYQIGYKLTIFNGMSGGPLLNNDGQLVGIIGIGQPIIFVNPDIYLYKDGSRVTESLGTSLEEALDFLSSLSWAIPSETLVDLSPSGLDLNLDSGR